MKRIILYSSIIGVLSVQSAFAFEGCREFYTSKAITLSKPQTGLKFSPGISVNKKDKLSIHIVKSDNVFLETSINELAQFLLGRALHLPELRRIVKSFLNDKSADPYFQKLARAFEIEVQFDRAELEKRVPKTGPLLIVANHPKNGSDGIAIAAAISLVRSDVRVALTTLLQGFPGMNDNAVFLNPYGGREAARFNLDGIKQMNQHIADGGVLVIFPSGEVSTKQNLSDNFAFDVEWKKGISNIISKNPSVQVMPLFVEGTASQEFHRIKHLKNPMAQAVLGAVAHVRQIAKNAKHPIAINMGTPIKGSELVDIFKDDLVAMAQYLRARTYALKGRYEQVKIDRVEEPITQVNNDELVQKELDAAGPITEVVFGKSSSMKIYNVTGEQAPQTLLKLGQLREENFRAAQEGSGKSSDTDIDPKTGAFDLFHHHFIARDLEQKTTAAYRLGMGDELLARGPGKDAFYLNRFADLSAMPVEMLSHTIEASRSFANFTEAGKNSIRGLSAVWKGIGRFLADNPRYRYMMGRVSISNSYSDVSKAIIVGYLKKTYPSKLSETVKAYTKPDLVTHMDKEIEQIVNNIKSLTELNSIINDIEGRGIPSLLISYEKLGAKYIDFSFDREFNTVDGVIVVDLVKLLETPEGRQELIKHMGEDGLAAYEAASAQRPAGNYEN
ncbi:MAG: lysophospholipid acyltransferase family protein [Bdellovibrionaceae bacterium]|nr:lysophospholipid acyltransferase family protein [Pseudobdellovibrionaceae bacterium]